MLINAVISIDYNIFSIYTLCFLILSRLIYFISIFTSWNPLESSAHWIGMEVTYVLNMEHILIVVLMNALCRYLISAFK